MISQLLQKIPKDKHRKVCKGCHDIGHNMNSAICKLNIEKNNLLHLFSFKTPILLGKNKKKCKINSRNL